MKRSAASDSFEFPSSQISPTARAPIGQLTNEKTNRRKLEILEDRADPTKATGILIPQKAGVGQKPEGGARCQVPDSSVCDEEVARSSTGSLSREAVPKEAPGSLANGTSILVPLALLFLLVGCSHLIRRRYQRVPGRKTRIIESIVSHPPPPGSSADYKIIITTTVTNHRPSPCPGTSRSTLNARLSH